MGYFGMIKITIPNSFANPPHFEAHFRKVMLELSHDHSKLPPHLSCLWCIQSSRIAIL